MTPIFQIAPGPKFHDFIELGPSKPGPRAVTYKGQLVVAKIQ